MDYLIPLSEDRFARALGDYIMSPEDELDDTLPDSPEPIPANAAWAAFTDPQLINRSVAAVRMLRRQTNLRIREAEGTRDKTRKEYATRQRFFLTRVARTHDLLETVFKGIKARAGIPDNAPNPKARAMERLWQLNLRGDVPKGLCNRLLAEEEAKVVEARKRAKAEAKRRQRERKLARQPES